MFKELVYNAIYLPLAWKIEMYCSVSWCALLSCCVRKQECKESLFIFFLPWFYEPYFCHGRSCCRATGKHLLCTALKTRLYKSSFFRSQVFNLMELKGEAWQMNRKSNLLLSPVFPSVLEAQSVVGVALAVQQCLRHIHGHAISEWITAYLISERSALTVSLLCVVLHSYFLHWKLHNISLCLMWLFVNVHMR